jgi:hypothetical protein
MSRNACPHCAAAVASTSTLVCTSSHSAATVDRFSDGNLELAASIAAWMLSSDTVK